MMVSAGASIEEREYANRLLASGATVGGGRKRSDMMVGVVPQLALVLESMIFRKA